MAGIGGKAKNLPSKLTLTMREALEARGIDLIDMAMEVYNHSMESFKAGRGYGERSDAGPAYLAEANKAIALLAKHTYPTMTAVKIEDGNQSNKNVTVDAQIVRATILADPFAQSLTKRAVALTDERRTFSSGMSLPQGLPIDNFSHLTNNGASNGRETPESAAVNDNSSQFGSNQVEPIASEENEYPISRENTLKKKVDWDDQ